ncbi:MAG: hypothetical protein A3G87_05720 [Omnitrophica bacterium RIFCSPLOWO2_12_FULL_50_11]|nr:MAG: hypothetical protein A3G87_05720 [Omnitrophica bacterium RIFCSPLOWO2_12_FULL_50_11]
MKNFFLVLLLVVLSIFPPQVMVPIGQAVEAGAVQLKRGTPVSLRLTQMVSSETSHLGDIVHMEVLRDVVVDGKVVIDAGTPVQGEVIAASDRGFIGEAGRVGISVKSTSTVDGRTVYLRSTLHREGEEKQTLSLVLGLVLCFLFLFMKGGEAEIMAGSEVKAYIDDDAAVAVKG